MSWTYGDTLCVQPHILVADWVYGETLCTTLASQAYPTSAKVRVTGLVHRWNPGMYLLEILLGDLTTDFAIYDVMEQPTKAPDVTPVPPTPPTPPVPPIPPYGCVYNGKSYTQGSYICQGRDRFVCFEGRWLLARRNAPECAFGCIYQGTTYPNGSVIRPSAGRALICRGGHWEVLL